MSKASKGIFAKTASTESTGSTEYFIGRQFDLMQGLSQPAALVSPLVASEGAEADMSVIVSPVSSSEESDFAGDLSLDPGEKMMPFGLPDITDEKVLRMMAQDSVNGRAGRLHGDDASAATDALAVTDGPIDDEPASVPITIGGSVTGVIDVTGDTDDIVVNLVAGQRYMISLMGTGTNALADSFLEVFGPTMALVNSDDDGGVGHNSLMTITAATTGTYTIRASAFTNPGDPGTGQYTVDVRQMGVDSVPSTVPSTVTIGQGITFGFRETATASGGADSDIYNVNLVAGNYYVFNVAGGVDHNTNPNAVPVGEIDTIIALRGPNGVATVLQQNDDIAFPTDNSSSIGFYATVTGTYYLQVTGYSQGAVPGRNTGGYVIDFHQVPLSQVDPLESIDWNNAANIPTVMVDGVPTAYIYFAAAGENFGENARAGDPTQPAGGGNGTLVSYGWTEYEKGQFMLAMQEYTKILGIAYVETANSAQATFRVITNSSLAYGAYAYPQDPAYGTQKGIMVFNVDNRGWNLDSADPAVTTDGLGRGGYAWHTILHEAGHAHGLAHPHDQGGGSLVMAGVTGAQGSLGVYNLNQGVYTQMSYNGGWQTHPDGSLTGSDPTGFRSDAGWLATMGAFDIAKLQQRYGVHPDYATGDNVYTLLDVNAEGTYFETIYDTGGNDTIAYGGGRDAQIDLGTATLDYSPTGGGIVSFVHSLPGQTPAQAIKGGYTIANGVVIENATGGSGNDVLIGNAAANVLTGNDGNDSFLGRGGNDTFAGGAGSDTANYGGAATITQTATGWSVTSASEGTDTLENVENVNDSAPGVTRLVGNGGYSSIQAAIDASSNGDTILIASGTWVGDVNVNKDVTILGPNQGLGGTATRGDEAVIDGQVTISAAGVTIDGVKIVGAAPGSLGETAVEVFGANFALTNSVLDGSGFVAIITSGVTGLDVSNNLITGYSIGAYISAGATGSIHDNRFQGDGGPSTGLGNGVNSESAQVDIADNVFDGIYGGSLNIFPFGPDSVDLNDYITGNTITNSGAARPVQIQPTNLTHNIVGTDFNEAFIGDNGIAGPLSFDGRGGDDKAWGSEQGDSLAGGSGDDQLFGNGGDDTLTGGSGNDVMEGGAGNDTAVVGSGATYSFDGTNWIVTSSEGTDTLNGIEIVDNGPGANVLLVGGGGFTTIQAAVGAASDGDTIVVAAGTYNETVTVNKDVTIQGPNAGVAGSGTRAAEAIVNGAFYITAAGATLDGLEVLNGATPGGNPAGVFVNADGVTLTNLLLQGQNTPSMPGIVTPYNGGITGLVLSNSKIAGWAQGAYFNPTTGFTASGNSFDGNGNAILGDDWDDSTLIENNSFTNSVGSHIGYGVLDTTDDVGAYFGTGNSFGGTNRPTSIFAYGDGTAAPQTVYGTELSNLMRGETAAENFTFHGRGGNDRLDGNGGNDILHGDAGNDDLRGGAGTDTAGYANDRSEYTLGVTTDAQGRVTGFTSVTDNETGNGDEGTDTLTGMERIQFGDVTLDLGQPVQLFDEEGNLVGTFTTIQAAVDASSDGETIRVAAGTYNETVNVHKDVTILGPNEGVPGTGSRGAEAIVNGGFYMSAAGATLDGLTVLNGAMPGGNSAGIFVNADNVTLANMILEGDGTAQRAGVTTTYNGGVTGLVLSDSLVTGWSWGAYFNPTTQFTVTGNSFDGNGNAIVGDDWAAGTFIDGNSFTDSAGSHIGYGSFDTVEDMRVYFNHAEPEEEGEPVELGNVFDAGSRAVSIYAYGDGTPGGQTITGTDDSNAIIASEFVPGSGTNSTFIGLGGDDYFYGGSSNDTLNGGAGTDTAAYDGRRGDYSVTMITGAGGRIVGFAAVSDNEPSDGNEGHDTLISIERLEFDGRTLDATLPVQLFDQNNQLIGTFTTIQAAIDGAQDNYTIRVAAGTYDEDLVIDVGVRILGARVTAVTGRDASGGVGETTIIGHAKVTAEDNVTLTGLRFLNDGTTTGGGPSNPTLQFLTGGGASGHLVSNSIFWSTVVGGANGVDDRAISAPLIAEGQLNFTGNLISGSSQGLFSTASWGRGIWVDGGGVGFSASGNIIEWTRSGLVLDGAGGSVYFVSNNTLRNLGTAFSIATTENALVESGNIFRNVGDEYNFRNLSEDVTFDAGLSGNTVQAVGTPNDVVVILSGSGNDILTGTSGADYIDANNRPGHLTVADSDTLNGVGGNDVLLGRFGTDTLNGGTGDDNLDGGDGNDVLNGNDDNDTLNGGAGDDRVNGGAGNDTIDGGSGIDTAGVGTGAVYTPNGTSWTVTSSDGTDTLTNVEVADSGPGPNVLLVGSGGFATIQAAVDAANDGDTILVAAGTYVEQVVVDNVDNLTIMAVVGAQVTIKAPADLVETGRSSSDREIHAVLTAKDSLNLTIQNIDIDGDGRGDTVDEGGGADQANFYGVFYRNSSGSLLDVDISGVRDPYPGGTAAGGQPLVSGAQRGVGLVVDNDALLAFTMTGGSISDFQKNATSFNRADLNIAGVTITGGGAQTVNAQNGILVANSTGSISANTISGIGYAGPANVYSGAILAFGNTNLTIAGNAITGANIDSTAAKVVGIWVFQSGAPNSGGMIVGNSISHVDEGIDVTGDITRDGIQIENNSITNVDGTNNDPVGVYFEPNPALVTAHDVDGSDGDDSLAGGAGNDSLSGLDGNDVLTGEGGDDTLNGAGHEDTAVYHGPRSGYSVTAVTDSAGRVTGFSTVDDINAGNGDEGADTLIDVERLQFGDVVLDLADRVQLFDGANQLVGTFDTIQAAVNAAASGYTIRLAAGTYAETVTVDEDVTILGPNAGIPASGTRSAEAIIDGGVHMSAAGATLDGLTVLGGGTLAGNPAGIYVDSDNVTLTNLVVQGDGTAGTGILTPYNGGVTGLVLSGSRIDDWTNGTYFNPTTQFTATGNSFDGNGVALTGDDWDDVTLISNNSFTNSSFGHVGYGAMDAVEDVGAFFGTGNSFDASGGRIGIFAYGTGQDVTGTGYGDYMADTVAGSGATFHGEGGDDYLDGGSGDDTLDGGAGNDFLDGGAGTDTVVLADSSFTISPIADVDPGTAGNQPGWTVTTASEGTDTLSGVEIVDSGAAGRVLLVGQGGFTTIQAAVDAASDGDTILVASGTYAETVTVNKDVTISGMNSGIPAGDPRNPETIIDGGVYMHAAGATLDGLTILGGGTLAGNPAGIYVDVDDVTLRNLIVQGDGSVGTGIVTPFNGGVSGLAISDSRIDDWTNGTYFNPGTQFTLSGNSFDGNGVALTGDDWDDGTLISSNSFTNSSFGHVGYGVFDSVDDVGAYFGTGNSFDASGGRIGIFAYGDGDAGGQEITGTELGDYMAGAEFVAGSGDGATFHGEDGNDYIDAGAGDDRLDGGAGDDILVGGSGTDTAVFADPITLADIALVADADPETAGDQPGWIVTTATEGTDRLVGVEIIDGGGADILFVGAGGFSTIQAAIDAADDGDTILVAAGTYDEDLQIHVGVTILGAKAGADVAGRDAAGGTGETNIVGHAHVTATANVTLDGLRFLNDGTTTGGGSANPTLQFLTGGGAAGHLVTNSIFWSTVTGGTADDRAISTVVITDGLISITDNLISGSSQGQFGTASWGRAIWFDGGGVDLVVTGNAIEWSRTGLNLDMSGDSTANVSDNSFRGLGTGIALGVDADGLTVSSNDIERVGTEFSFRNLTTGVTFNAGAAIGVLTTVGDANDVVVVLGGSGNDSLTGTAGADLLDGNNSPTNPVAADTDVLNGLGGNDTLLGRGGNDTLDGGTGDDSMTGGAGDDIYIVDTAGDSVTEASGEGTDEVRTALATYTLAAALENLTGLGNVDQTLTGNSSNNVIDGGLGADAMAGGTGNDTYVVDNAGDTVTENFNEGNDEIRTSLTVYTLGANVHVETLRGTNAAGQTLTGNGFFNTVIGAAGNDIIDGGMGPDIMIGGAGNDIYIVDNSADSIQELAGEGTDEVRTGLNVYSMAAFIHIENLTATNNFNHDFRGNLGNNVITGGAGNDLLRLYDGGDDTVIAGDGLDSIFFGATLTAADVVNGGGGVDTLVLQGNYAGGLTISANVTQIENVSILAGTNTAFGETGNNRYDYVLTTNDANFAAGVQARINASALLADEDFTFDGSAETDGSFVVYGGKGKDTLLGGFGNDIFIYAEDRFQPGDTVNGGPGGYDGIFLRGNYTIDFNAPGYFGLMNSIENMTLTSITDERYARGGDPAGFDYNITLADNMLLAGVELTVSGTILTSSETMIVDGSLETDGNFRLFGGRANDTLKGGAQNDLLHGNLGADQLTGGGGADTFRFDNTTHSNSASLDHILDFTPGTDKIDLDRVDANSFAAGNQAFTWIGSNAFTGSGAASAGQLRAFQSGGSWMLEGDTNGDGVADLVIQLTLQGPTPLSASDFFL